MTYKNFFPIQHNSYDKPDLHNTYYPFFTSDKGIGEFLSPLSPDFCENSFFDFLPSKKNQFPKVDISETKDSYLITAELPGIDEKNVDVTLDEKILSIKGDKKEEIEVEQSEFYSRERSYGIFQRDFQVSETIDKIK